MDITYTFMLPVLEFMAKVLGSYGWAILGLTLLVRILVWPLVAAQTKSMQRMSQLRPMLKDLQDRYKDQPEVFQKKTVEFYQKNKINPLGGCLPMLVQLPVLFALFGTFTGPPFQEKPIPVKINLLAQDKRDTAKVTIAQTSGASSPYVSKSGEQAKIVVHPGDSVLVFGENANGEKSADGKNNIDFSVDAVEGKIPSDFKVKWKLANDPNKALITAAGEARFPAAGEVRVEAVIPAQDGQAEQVIPVTVKVLPKDEKNAQLFNFGPGGEEKEKRAHSEQTAQVEVEGKKVNLALEPGNMTVTAGRAVAFSVIALEGERPASIVPTFRIASDSSSAQIDEAGHATFSSPGEYTVEAIVPAVAKDEPFYFITSIGKIVTGTALFKPENFDVLSMILLFGITMFISSKLMVTTPPEEGSEEAAIQKQTQQIMPVTITAMFFFFPLPAGVYLYMVFSNIVQTLQTWLLMQSPAPALIGVSEDAATAIIDVKPKEEKGKGKKAASEQTLDFKPELRPENSKGKAPDNKGASGAGDKSAKITLKESNQDAKLSEKKEQGK